DMNLIGSYQHHHLMREPFPFVSRCHQDNPYFQSWVVSHGEVTPELHLQPSYSSEFVVPGPAPEQGPLEALDGRMGRRRVSAPKKERRRTESINSAFAELRECIPNVPADTKLSKIKTLRLATSYIAYLMDVLAKDAGETEGFKAEIKKFDNRDLKRKREASESVPGSLAGEKRLKGRTGWPQQVWALELNQ
ncbi:HAND1 protein, partial [Atractosteus spatula]|nr:HAND1 protein [Atractosteus spatula]